MTAREQLRVLVVDDQDSMRQLLCAGLRNLGIQHIHTAADGVEALAKLRARTIDLVLLDGEMPRMGGFETLTAMRSDAVLSKVRVIMVTGRADTDFVQRTAKLGIDGYLVKPVTTVMLGARIDAAARALG